MKKATERRAKRSRRAKDDLKALKHAARCTPSQLAALLAQRLHHRPEQLAKLAGQFARLADVRQQLRDTRRELRQLRAAQKTGQVQPQAPAPTSPTPPLDPLLAALAAESQRLRERRHAMLAITLEAANFPASWAAVLDSTTSDPWQVAESLLAALRRRQ